MAEKSSRDNNRDAPSGKRNRKFISTPYLLPKQEVAIQIHPGQPGSRGG